jgi:hypothetical protein
MKRSLLPFITILFLSVSWFSVKGQNYADSILPVRGLAIAVPSPAVLDSFITFINEELAPKKVNTLVLRVDYNYQYKSHPELVDKDALTQQQVKKIVDACRKNKIRIVPQINLLGHQSWASSLGKLLQVYPQFDETPHVKIPENYAWPNPDNLYCKSYCPLHPDVHKIVFELVDEICDAFGADAFHAGMDEVFYIGDDKCPRCSGRDKAELFAKEVTKIQAHLASKNRELWIWGDRLIDGKTTGIGMWEASLNNTHRAIDMIPKEVVICDWHYERPDKTAVYFAMKGFRVITCSWRKPEVAIKQVQDMVTFRKESPRVMKDRFHGVMETIWTSVGAFLQGYYRDKKAGTASEPLSQWQTFNAMFREVETLSKNKGVVTQ